MIAYRAEATALRQSLPANDTYQEAVQIVGTGITVRANPGAGGAVTVRYTLSPVSEVEADTATWYTAPLFNGVAVASEDVIVGRVTAIRAKQTGGSAAGSLEVAQ